MAHKEGLVFLDYVMQPGNVVKACRMTAPFRIRGLRGQVHKGIAGDYVELTAENDIVVHRGDDFEAEFELADPQVADRLAFYVQPSNVENGEVITPSVVVEIRDASNVRVLGATNQVTIAKQSGDGTLGGTLSRNAINGRALFNNLAITGGEGAHVLRATSSGLTLADSNSFDVEADELIGVPHHLVFTIQPSDSEVDTPFGTQPVVEVRDVYDNLCDEDDATEITLAIASGSGTLGGDAVKTTVNGVVAFTDLEIDAEDDFTLEAMAPGLTPDTSDEFTVSEEDSEETFNRITGAGDTRTTGAGDTRVYQE